MVESWVGSMSRLLPRAIQEAGHTFTFLTRDLHHYLRTAPEGAAHPLLGARDVVTADTNDPESLLPYVERLHEVLGFDGVLTSCDYYLPTAALLAERLGLTAPDPEAVRNACRKDATRRVLEKAGVPGPRFAVHEDRAELGAAARDIGYPLVVKPVDLCAGMFVRRVDDDGQLAAAVRALGDFPVNARGQRRAPAVLLEELLDGPEVSVETVSHAGAVAVVGVTDKSVGGAPAFIETGHMFPAALSDAETEDVVRTAVDALTALGLTDGVVAHTEIKLTSAGPRVVEVNPRPAGKPHHRTRPSCHRSRPRRGVRRRLAGPGARPAAHGHRTAVRRRRVPRAGGHGDARRPGRLRAAYRAGRAGGGARRTRQAGAGGGQQQRVPRARHGGRHRGAGARERVEGSARLAAVGAGDPMTAVRPASAGTVTYETLLARARGGELGPDPAGLRVAVAFTTRQAVRHDGRGTGYRNEVLGLRVGAAVGSCAVEPGATAAGVVEECAGAGVDRLLDHPLEPVRVAALDAYLMHVAPHTPAHGARPVRVPAGTSLEKSRARARAVVGLLDLPPPGPRCWWSGWSTPCWRPCVRAYWRTFRATSRAGSPSGARR